MIVVVIYVFPGTLPVVLQFYKLLSEIISLFCYFNIVFLCIFFSRVAEIAVWANAIVLIAVESIVYVVILDDSTLNTSIWVVSKLQYIVLMHLQQLLLFLRADTGDRLVEEAIGTTFNLYVHQVNFL